MRVTENVIVLCRDYLIHSEEIYYALPEGHTEALELKKRIETMRGRLDIMLNELILSEVKSYFK